jgi:Fe(II)/alpha-ketoglutarate-dependent arginine beta-hydroxylase
MSLERQDLAAIEDIVASLAARHRTVESVDFLEDCKSASGVLPEGLKKSLQNFRNMEMGSAFFVLSGFTIDDKAIGPSPENWNAPWSDVPYLREEIYQCLIMSGIGDIFGYRTLEQGRFLRHVTPDKQKMGDQVAGSSAVTLEWHTEEAFHPCRGDFQSLMCYRNHEEAVTNIAQVCDLDLDEDVWRILRQSRFYIRPDQAHQPGEYGEASALGEDVFQNVQALTDDPEPRPLVTGPRHCPFLIVDQAFMDPLPGDDEAAAALTKLLKALEAANRKVVLSPGDLLLFDNQRAPHGRSAFTPLWGAEKRWLRVLYATADLRKSVGFRKDVRSRAVA